MSEPLVIDYFSDVLCVWAYVGEIRLAELEQHYGERISIRHHFIPLFGAAHQRIQNKWKKKGGFEGYADHVQKVVGGFDHVRVHEGVWRTHPPTTSHNAHLVLRAVEPDVSSDVFENCISAMRTAFFEHNQAVDRMETLWEIAGECGASPEAARERLEGGEPMAALCRDIELRDSLGVEGSPTYVLNHGRQKLYGNVGYKIIEANVEECLRLPEHQTSWC